MNSLLQARANVNLRVKSWYQTRDGTLVQIIDQSKDKHVVDPFTASNGVDYYPDGNFYPSHLNTPHSKDLLREISRVEDLIELISVRGWTYKIEGDNALGTKVTILCGVSCYTHTEYGGGGEVFLTLLTAYLECLKVSN